MYFSDKENGVKDRISEEITLEIWNGIVSVFEEFKSKNCFSEKFSEFCHDNGRICGFNNKLFESRIKAEIPNIEIPILIKQEEIGYSFDVDKEDLSDNKIDKYVTLDFAEFCYKNIKEALRDDFHDFFKHYHLNFNDSKTLQKSFKDKINQIFERNGIVFYINEDGQINRTISKTIQPLINKIYNTNDARLNELVKLAQDKFVLPKVEDRIHALEKIWDAFERAKTYYIDKNKKESILELIQLVANGNTEFEKLINEECTTLTKIGNDYQIRHFETDRIEITDNKHIDYLFYRIVSIIHLFLSELE
jgi:hypothetical protein